MRLVRASTREVGALISLIYQYSRFTLVGVERASEQNDKINHKKRQSIRKHCGTLFETAECL